MLDIADVTCPFCDKDFEVYSDIFDSIGKVENAAERLLERYQCRNPSAGDVQKLKEIITEALVSEFGIGKGRIKCDC